MDADARLDAAVGSVAEEATRLLLALGGTPSATPPWEDRPADGPATDVPGAGREHVHVPMGGAETCTWCPVCRSVGVLRSVSPETLARLADLATAAATALSDLATRHTEENGEGRREPAGRTPRTEPITVVDEEELT